MMGLFEKLIGGIIRFSTAIAVISVLLLVLSVCTDVTMRYLFNNSLTWLTELETYLFATIFMLGAAATLTEDKHVAVDVLSQSWSERSQTLVRWFGHIFLLGSWVIVSVQVCWYYMVKSWSIMEVSPQPDGLQIVYIFKTIIWFGIVLLGLQVIQLALKTRSS